MSERVTGRCNCGQYKITMPKGTKMNLCHCTDCRRWAGAMWDSLKALFVADGPGTNSKIRYSAHIVVDEKDLVIEGPEPRTHTVKGIEGVKMLRAWCDTCGSGLYIERVGGKGSNKYIKAGLFEPGDVPKPTFETFTKDMESWESKAEGAEHYEKNIPGI